MGADSDNPETEKEREMRKILVIGNGAREHALAWRCAQDPDTRVYCAPGNAGMHLDAGIVPIEEDDFDKLLFVARREHIDLTIVGPEGPLVDGIVDRFRNAGQLIFGPTADAARAEGSKAWFKRFLSRHHLPTADFAVFNDPEEAYAYIKEKGVTRVVIKADGLMGGKGVFLPRTHAQAREILAKLMRPNAPGEQVVIEERLEGIERSVTMLTDGIRGVVLPFVQDYKRLRDGDRGPNTGGMGAHTVSLPKDERDELTGLAKHVIRALRQEGIRYTGFLYLGVIMAPTGPMILECNCRLGDPEAQVILPSITGDFTGYCQAAASGELFDEQGLRQVHEALCVVLASGTYPDSKGPDDPIGGLRIAQREVGALLFHGNTKFSGKDGFTTNRAGRILSCVGVDDVFANTRMIAHTAAEMITFPGKHFRRDIGAGY